VISGSTDEGCSYLTCEFENIYAKLAQIYIKEIVRLHGVLSSIVSDWDPKFIS